MVSKKNQLVRLGGREMPRPVSSHSNLSSPGPRHIQSCRQIAAALNVMITILTRHYQHVLASAAPGPSRSSYCDLHIGAGTGFTALEESVIPSKLGGVRPSQQG